DPHRYGARRRLSFHPGRCRRMRRLLPDSLAAWALLILICGLVATEIATLAVVADAHASGSRMVGFFHLAERVSSATRAIAAQPADDRPALATALSDP